MMIPDGWTDNMNITIEADRTPLDLVKAIMERIQDLDGGPQMLRDIASEFALTDEDAFLAFDRVQGGIIRALTSRPDNCPDQAKDPIAWYSFHETWRTLPQRHWWTRRKKPGGPWMRWSDALREKSNKG